MKRRISKITHQDPSLIMGATLLQQPGRLRGVRSSDFRIPNPTSQSTKGSSPKSLIFLRVIDFHLCSFCFEFVPVEINLQVQSFN